MPDVIADLYDQTVVLQVLISESDRLLLILKSVLFEAGFKHLYL